MHGCCSLVHISRGYFVDLDAYLHNPPEQNIGRTRHGLLLIPELALKGARLNRAHPEAVESMHLRTEKCQVFQNRVVYILVYSGACIPYISRVSCNLLQSEIYWRLEVCV